MTFGRRVTTPPFKSQGDRSKPVARRGGYPLALLTVGVGSYLAALFMAFVPFFNPTKRSFGEVAMVAPLAVLNVLIVAAVVLLLVDLLFRALKVSSIWAYAMAGGGLTFGLCFGLALALGSNALLLALTAVMVLVPTIMGGSVLGMFRTAR